MFIVTVKTLSQAAEVRDFLQGRAELTFNKDFTVRIGAVDVPIGIPHREHIIWKFLSYHEFEE